MKPWFSIIALVCGLSIYAIDSERPTDRITLEKARQIAAQVRALPPELQAHIPYLVLDCTYTDRSIDECAVVLESNPSALARTLGTCDNASDCRATCEIACRNNGACDGGPPCTDLQEPALIDPANGICSVPCASPGRQCLAFCSPVP